jgi:histidinol phosphatase-like PHP family hydrolase
MFESLHNHTLASDGAQTYSEVLEAAEKLKIGVIAFTDHDVVPSASALEKLSKYDGPVKWLIGSEISSGLPRQLGGSKAGMIHILGLFTDPTNRKLIEHSSRAISARSERMERMVGNLRNLGFKISVDDCLGVSGGENVGRPHIVKALNLHPENQVVLDGLKKQMEHAAKLSPTVAMDYIRMLDRRPSDYPYRLFLSDDAFIKGVYVDYLYAIDLDESVSLIRQAGGRAGIAHWWTYINKLDESELKTLLTEGRLDFVEAYSGFVDARSMEYGKKLIDLSSELGLEFTIGIDGHSQFDMQNFLLDIDVIKQGIGQTQRLIDAYKPDLKWTNF